VTPKGTYELPVQVSNASADIFSNFSFAQTDTGSPAKAACLALLLRTDYAPLTGLFTGSSTYPSAEVLVCPLWTTTLAQVGNCSSVSVVS
jgi:hypothetical protein